MIDTVLQLLAERTKWLYQDAHLVSKAMYTFLRLCADHTDPHHTELRQREVDFCMMLWRERIHDCIAIGRDLLRLLQDVARIHEFETVWKDLILKPEGLAPGFSGVPYLLEHQTSRRLLGSRLTPEMETQLLFLMTKVFEPNH